MILPPFTTIVPQRGHGDCGIAALATFLGRSYEDVFEATIGIAPSPHHRGLWMSQIMRVAATFGVTLRRRRKFNIDEDTGIIGIRRDHVGVLREGIVIDSDGPMVWFEPAMSLDSYGPLLRLED